MSRKLIYVLCMGVVATAIIAVMFFGIGTAFSVMFLGGMADIFISYRAGVWGVDVTTGIAKIIASGPIALVSVWAIQKMLDLLDWLRAWRLCRA